MAAIRKKIGIWMDHSMAHLMEYSNNGVEVKTIESNFTQQQKVNSLQKGELHLHNVELQKQAKYYKKLIDIIKKYNQVILFGPTNAKEELFNVLSADKRFENIKINVEPTDKMTPNERHAFVLDFFLNK
ncbi:hypothetical protein L1S35_08055 [Flavobacterium sp. AS60]|uniref:hypothetical protein n=1 Tax=Flavobacterium anseongense TaxID=2910677 RepID=UPI001F28EB7A|nr:hypothetical protein [Flavobacterium sp. AS60]MCF6129622.1 hypothetical protein [Flavobacterium sp. AS60]